jgi:hypothetical protein
MYITCVYSFLHLEVPGCFGNYLFRTLATTEGWKFNLAHLNASEFCINASLLKRHAYCAVLSSKYYRSELCELYRKSTNSAG